MACFLSDEVTVAQRAAQVVGDLGRRNPASLEPWWEEMLQAGQQPVHDAIRRNIARYFSELELTLPRELERSLVRLMTDWACDSQSPVAIVVFSMQFVANRAKRFSDEADQIRAQIESRLPTGSAGFKSRGKMILTQLSERLLSLMSS